MHDPETSTDHFDLLPFISILMCVLGVLLLVTISMAAISMGVGAGEVWIPTQQRDALKNSNKDAGKDDKDADLDAVRQDNKDTLIPILVEWDGKEAVFHGENDARIRIPVSEPSNIEKGFAGETGDAKFAEQIAKLEATKQTHYVLMAVRPTGFSTFAAFAAEFRRKKIVIGYEPIDQLRPVKLQNMSVPHRSRSATAPASSTRPAPATRPAGE